MRRGRPRPSAPWGRAPVCGRGEGAWPGAWPSGCPVPPRAGGAQSVLPLRQVREGGTGTGDGDGTGTGTGTRGHRDGNGRGTGPGTGTGTGGWVSDRDRGPGRGAEPVPGSPVLFRSLALGSDLCQCPVPVIAPLRPSPPGAAGEQGTAGSVPGGAGGSGAVLLGSSPRAAWAGALHCSHL